MTTADSASSWVQRHAERFPAGAAVLDVACGSGRHSRFLAARGCRVLAVDRDLQALRGLRGVSGVTLLCADLENAAWPLTGARFAAVLVTRYLWRPTWPQLLAAVAPGGVWVHETFTQGQELLGRPRRPEFLLRPGELRSVAEAAGFAVEAFEEGEFVEPTPVRLQRIVARRPA